MQKCIYRAKMVIFCESIILIMKVTLVVFFFQRIVKSRTFQEILKFDNFTATLYKFLLAYRYR